MKICKEPVLIFIEPPFPAESLLAVIVAKLATCNEGVFIKIEPPFPGPKLSADIAKERLPPKVAIPLISKRDRASILISPPFPVPNVSVDIKAPSSTLNELVVILIVPLVPPSIVVSPLIMFLMEAFSSRDIFPELERVIFPPKTPKESIPEPKSIVILPLLTILTLPPLPPPSEETSILPLIRIFPVPLSATFPPSPVVEKASKVPINISLFKIPRFISPLIASRVIDPPSAVIEPIISIASADKVIFCPGSTVKSAPSTVI